MDTKARLEVAKTQLQKAQQEKVVAETQLGTAQTQLEELTQQMAADGVTPDTIQEELMKLDVTIDSELTRIEGLIPQV